MKHCKKYEAIYFHRAEKNIFPNEKIKWKTRLPKGQYKLNLSLRGLKQYLIFVLFFKKIPLFVRVAHNIHKL